MIFIMQQQNGMRAFSCIKSLSIWRLYGDVARSGNDYEKKTADNLAKRILLQTCENFFER